MLLFKLVAFTFPFPRGKRLNNGLVRVPASRVVDMLGRDSKIIAVHALLMMYTLSTFLCVLYSELLWSAARFCIPLPNMYNLLNRASHAPTAVNVL